MNEGYWINYGTGKEFPIDEHERFLRTPGNAQRLGVPKAVIAMFGKFKPEKDRDKFLMFVMAKAPVMRVRGHGGYVAFEYSSSSRRDPMDAIWKWGKKNAGPFTSMYIVNFGTKETTSMPYSQFEELMESSGPEAVMRAASRKFSLRKSVARELLRLSKEILGKE